MHPKYDTLLDILKNYDRVGICLSGGSGSALVAVAAVEALGAENVVAITANTPFFTGEELLSSKDLCKRLGVKLYVPNTNLLMNTEVVTNGPDRCYYCKVHVRCCAEDGGGDRNPRAAGRELRVAGASGRAGGP